MRCITPPNIRAPFANYSHAVEVPQGHRLLVVSGQLGITPGDMVPPDAGEQAALCFANIGTILAAAFMGPENVVRINAFVTDRADLPAYMAVRDRFLDGTRHIPASTLMIVSGFAREEFKVEVEVLAASDMGSFQAV